MRVSLLLCAAVGLLAFATAPALAAAPAAPETKPATAIGTATATVHGVLDPKAPSAELVVEYEFFYAPRGAACTEAYVAPELPGMATGKEGEEVEIGLTSLEPSTEYAVCIAARNTGEEGWTTGNSVPFKTNAAPPTVAAPPSTSITPTEARLEGLVNPNNQATECHVQYGTDASLATETTLPCEAETLEGYGAQGSLTLSGLTQATTYYFRVIAKNASGEEKGAIEHFTTGTPESPETGDVTPVEATEATLHGVLNPKHAGTTGTYEFVYRQSVGECQGEGEKKAPEPAATATGNKEAVQALVSGLLPGAMYTFCVVAKNAAEEAAVGKPVTFTTLAVAPTIASQSVSTVEATAATLEAEIDPGGAPTTYHFEYLTEAQFNANGDTFTGADATPQSASIGAGDTLHAVAVRITGLLPGTTYHYRVVATNEVAGKTETEDGKDKTFTTHPASGSEPTGNCANEQLRAEQPFGLELPDCRAYEMVSPEETGGQDATDSFIKTNARAAVSSQNPAITYASKGSFGDPMGAAATDQFVSRRNAKEGRWETQAITPLFNPGQTTTESAFEATVFTPELTGGIASTDASLPSTEPPSSSSEFKLYAADFVDGSYQYLGPGLRPQGASTDLDRVVLENREDAGLEEWVGGTDVPVSVGNVAGEGMAASAGSAEYSVEEKDAWHATSEDGTRVYFTTPPTVEGYNSGIGQLYVRVNIGQKQSGLGPKGECLEPAQACTIEVSASQREPEDPVGPQSARYWGASANGGKVFFTSNAELTDDAYTGPEDNAANLYECEPVEVEEAGHKVIKCDLTDLTSGKTDSAGEGAAVQGVVQISEEGQYIYFVAKGALNGEHGEALRNASGAEPVEEEDKYNLYVSHEGEALRFISTLEKGDEPDWQGGSESTESGPEVNTAVVNPSGSRLAFLSGEKLKTVSFPGGYDNTDANTGAPDNEVYLYDAETNMLECASCNPTGARPVGPSSFASNAGQSGSDQYRQHNLVEDGTLFFDSSDALSPPAKDGRENVYEYEDGHIYAISNVAGGDESFFLDASASGEDVFFASADKLLTQDTGDNVVVWDARRDGGFPVPAGAPSCDNADSCKPPESPQPTIFGAPPSATFSGPGNTTPAVSAVATPKQKTAAELKAAKLAKALELCKRDKKKVRRKRCEASARGKYGSAEPTKAKKSTYRKGSN